MGNIPGRLGNTTVQYVKGEVLNFPLGFHHQEVLWAEWNVKQIVYTTQQKEQKERNWGDDDYFVSAHSAPKHDVLFIDNMV